MRRNDEKYVTPDLEGNQIAYKGRRYWVVELAEGRSFQCIDTSVAHLVVFDRRDNAPIARVTRIPGEGFEVTTVMGLSGPEQADSLREAVRLAVTLAEEELKACL